MIWLKAGITLGHVLRKCDISKTKAYHMTGSPIAFDL